MYVFLIQSRDCSHLSCVVLLTALGHALAEAKRPLVYGGGNMGIMGIVSGAVADEGGQVTGIIPYAIHAAGGEKDKGNGVAKTESVAEVLNEDRRGHVRDFVNDYNTPDSPARTRTFNR
jgi:predicted Rossmann-fold nucleotide-binding protein